MHLKSLTLKGFKSFASATTLKFEPGICAVVGPNGSGKSNVVDALAWVMGEQGAKSLRGNSMQDVIFAGTGSKKPLGRAEVTLTIDNHDGALPIEYREVAITRRMFRDGASEYEINGSRARLLDVQELLSDSGIGREMHVIVGQGRLSQILESRPEERRAFIEEAAGVRKHRRRKDQAQRKLNGMQANLDRLEDLTGELRRQLKPLARQAEAAKKAAVLQAEVRQLRGEVAAYQLQELASQLTQAQAQHEQLQQEAASMQHQQAQAQETVTATEAELAAIQPVVTASQENWFALSALAERVAATQRIATERLHNTAAPQFQGTDPAVWQQRLERAQEEQEACAVEVEVATARLESIAEQLDDAAEAAQQADAEHLAQLQARSDFQAGVAKLTTAEAAAQQQLEQIASTIEQAQEASDQAALAQQEATEQVVELEEALAELTQQRSELQQEQEHSAAELASTKQRLEELRSAQLGAEKEVARLESRIDTLELTLEPTQPADFLGALGEPTAFYEAISAQPGWEKAVAVVVERIDAALVLPTGYAQLLQAVQAAEITHAARTIAFSAEPASSNTAQSAQRWHLDVSLPAGAQWFIDVVTVIPELVPTCSQLWADIAVVETLEQAQRLVSQEPRLRVVTQDGVLLGQGWILFGKAQQSPVETQAGIAQARAALAEAQATLREGSGVVVGAQQAMEAAQVAAAGAQARLRDHDHQLSSTRRDYERAQRDVAQATNHNVRAQEQLRQAEQRQTELQAEIQQLRDRLSRVEHQEMPEAPAAEQRDAAQATLRQVQAMHTEARLQLRTLEERAGQADAKVRNMQRQMQQEQRAAAQYAQQQQKYEHQMRLAAFVQEHAEDLAQRITARSAAATTRREQLQQQLQQLQAQLQAQQQTFRSLQQQASALEKRQHQAELQASKVAVRYEELQESAAQQVGIPAGEIVQAYPVGTDFEIASAREQLQDSERRLQSLGKVNPLALEEYRALEERYEYLATQLADVQQARADLQQVITDVDAHILQLFRDAWVDVEAEFPKVFATLFPGGEGRLVLTDPDDLETTGIEIEARPPGKRIKRLSLLSGGEKSLTALAMLVAIFRARPSPFYVMDEVEAALDDVNLRRLLALFAELREESQLIVITHQKPTMNMANVLYGVTMRGDGITQVVSQRMQRTPVSDEATSQATAAEAGRETTPADAPTAPGE